MNTSNSHEGIDLTAELDALDRSRRQMLMAVVATSSVWMLSQILAGILGDRMPHTLSSVLIIAGVIGALAYVVFMMRFHRFQTRVRSDPELRQRLDDERVIEARKNAVFRGWVVLVIAIGIGVAVAPFAELPDQVVLLTLMLIAVNAPILFFLALDRS